jgi:hypothetical protein
MKTRGKNQGNSRTGFIIALLGSARPSLSQSRRKRRLDASGFFEQPGVTLILFLQGLAMAVKRIG